MQIKTSSHPIALSSLLLFFAALASGCGDKDTSGDDSARPALDGDGDGVLSTADCDDDDPDVKPGWREVCDGKDNNCDGVVDEGVDLALYADVDGDGYGAPGVTERACELRAGFTDVAGDCDDSKASVNPGRSDDCDGLDNNCDGLVDEGGSSLWYLDDDGDGYGGDVLIEACDAPSGYVATPGDCDDSSGKVSPAAREVCDDFIDNDCDGGASACRYAGYSSDAPVHVYSGASVTESGGSVGFGQSIVRLERAGQGDLLVIGAPYVSGDAEYGGEVYALAGEPNDGDKAGDSASFTVYGEKDYTYLGERLGRVGDLDGDGAEELLLSLNSVGDGGTFGSLAVMGSALTTSAGVGGIGGAFSSGAKSLGPSRSPARSTTAETPSTTPTSRPWGRSGASGARPTVAVGGGAAAGAGSSSHWGSRGARVGLVVVGKVVVGNDSKLLSGSLIAVEPSGPPPRNAVRIWVESDATEGGRGSASGSTCSTRLPETVRSSTPRGLGPR